MNELKSVPYCMSCKLEQDFKKRIDVIQIVKRLKQTSKSHKQRSKSKKSWSVKQPGRKAMWQDMIVNDEELVRKVIFTKVKKRKKQ